MLSLTLSLVLALTLLPGMALAAGEGVAIDDTNFPDANFQKYIKDVLDTNEPKGVLDADEIAKVTELTFEYPDSPGVKMSNIASLKGIEYFTNLTTLDCSEQKLTTLDVSANTKLTKLKCSENRLTSLDLSKNTALTDLDCDYNRLETLDVSKNLALTELACYNNQLTALNVGANTVLKELVCSYNQLESLNVSANTALTRLTCDNNQLTSLDVSKNAELTKLFCDSNRLTTLDVSKNTDLTMLYCGKNQLTSLDISGTQVKKYENFIFGDNQYTLGLAEGKDTFDLTTLPGNFDVSKVGKFGLSGGTIDGNILKIAADTETVRYQYDCGNDLTAEFQLKVHADPVRTIKLVGIGTGTVSFGELKAGYNTVEVKNFYIQNAGNMPTGQLKVMLEGTNPEAFRLTIDSSEITPEEDGSILLPSIGLDGSVPPDINYQPVGGLSAGTYTAKVTVKSADDDGKAISESFNISVTVKSNGTTPTNSGYAFQVTAPTKMTVGQDYTNAFVRLYATSDAKVYSNVLIKIAVAGPEGGTATIKAEDTAGTEWDMAKIGFWGPSEGFPVAANYDATTSLTHLSFDKAGTYTATFTLVDRSKHDAVLATGTHTVEVLPESTPVTHTVSFNANGGTGTMEDVTVTGASAAYTLPTCGFTAPQGTRFKGWATSANGAVLTDATITVTEDITLYAIWETTSVTPVTPTTPTQPAAPKLPFTDVSEDDWFYADAAYLYEKGVMRGTDDETFDPGRSVTRGQLAAALYRMAGAPAVTAKVAFTDVPADYWCAAAITWAAENGIVTGYQDGGFRPADAVQRQELAAMLFRFAVYQGMSAVTLRENLTPFADRADVAAYAVPAMNWAVGQGILQGKDGSLLPQAPVDRAQLAAILHRYLEK